MWWGSVFIYESNFSFLCCNRFHICTKQYICFSFFSRSLSVGLSLVYCSPCFLMCSCAIVLFLGFLRCFLVRFSVRPGQFLSKPCLIALRRLDVVGFNSAAWRYCASSGLVVWDRMVFVAAYDCCVSMVNSTIPFFLSLVTFIISYPFLWTYVSCLSNVMVHPSSHKTPNYITGGVFISGDMWICLYSLFWPGIWSVAVCYDSIVLPSRSLAVMSFEIMTGYIFVVAYFDRCIFTPESTIDSVFLLGEFGGFPIRFIKLILGLLISILFIIAHNRHLHPFLILPIRFL